MKLTINDKNVVSIFRLIGKDENALTFALGYAFSQDTNFLIDFLKHTQIIQKIQGKNYLNEFVDLSVALQKYNDNNSGIKDILIETKKLRVVIEAKTDNSFPTEKQITKYADNQINKNWEKHDSKYILILTRRQVNINNYTSIEKKLDEVGITLKFSTWADIYGLLRKNLFNKPSTIQEFILTELTQFITKDYEVNIIEQEVLYRKVTKAYYEQIPNFDGFGFYFDGAKSREDFLYPSCQFFLACHGRRYSAQKTGEFIRKIISYDKLSYDEIRAIDDPELQIALNKHLAFFPDDRTTTEVYHVFKLGKKIPVHPSKVNFVGSDRGYTQIEHVLTEN
jgi:hypothetical protein